MVWHSIIYRPGDLNCKNNGGANEGHSYDELSRLTGFGEVGGAIIGDVCNSNYTNQLQDIGQSVKDLQNSIKLDCSPFDSNGDRTPDVTVESRADVSETYQLYNADRQFQGDRIIFTELLPPGDYKVDYKCGVN